MIVFCHLLNDTSGSPMVLRQAIRALAPAGEDAVLFVGSQGRGALETAGVPIQRYWYRRSGARIVTLFTYLASQLFLYRALVRARLPADALVYVNTLLPFGAALWGHTTGRRVIYHLHEVSVTPGLLRRFLTDIARRTAARLIYVSNDHRARLPIADAASVVIANPVDPDLLAKARATAPRARTGVFEVLMLASPRDFKGVPECLALARALRDRDDIRFTLVLNGTPAEVDAYLAPQDVPDNLAVHPRTEDPAGFLAAADLVVNLSRVDLWIETFGLTLIEAMAFGVPVIAPPIGGPVEIVTDGREGWLIDSRDPDKLQTAVTRMADDTALYAKMSAAARDRAGAFTFEAFSQALSAVVRSVQTGEPRP